MALSRAERQANVDRVRRAGEQLEMVENGLLNMIATLPGMQRTVADCRAAILDVMDAARPKDDAATEGETT